MLAHNPGIRNQNVDFMVGMGFSGGKNPLELLLKSCEMA